MTIRTRTARRDPLVRVLATYRDPERQGFDDAWVGLEPTFQTRHSIELYAKHADDDERFFRHPELQRKLRDVARRIEKKVLKNAQKSAPPAWCFFASARRKRSRDKWDERRQQIDLRWGDRRLEALELKLGLDPSTFEFGIKPIPLAWLYDERFAELLEVLVFGCTRKAGLRTSMGEGGGQFHVSAKTLLSGSLLADVVATALNHPELSTWTLDWPNGDDRALRATRERRAACERVLEHYWSGAFHPRAHGELTAGDVLFGMLDLDGDARRRRAMHRKGGSRGSAREVFQTNFAFGRAVKELAQSVHPGYWQNARPDDDGYRPEQVMRYSECNLARLQIAGELHVKDYAVLAPERVPDADAPLELAMLAPEASLELRRHMSRTSARDMLDAVLLELHHMRYLAQHPRVEVARSLLQDQLLADAETTVRKHAGARALGRLHKQARAANLEASGGRLKSGFIEPETLFFAAWRALPAGERAAIAREAVRGFSEFVHEAASADPRGIQDDPMEPHRHRVHPLLWQALERTRLPRRDPAGRELALWRAKQTEYLARRPPFSLVGAKAPWLR